MAEATGKVLLINTGGTMCMVHAEADNPLSPLVPVESWEEVVGDYPLLDAERIGVDVEYQALSQLVDSSEMQKEHWQEIAGLIGSSYDKYRGFVVVHGTDTMCYTASALSFMLENLAKPVILTGSQRPLLEPRSDAAQNLVTSLMLAAGEALGRPVVPEVCIFFRDHLFRGNRARKLSASGYAGFASPNYPVLASAGEHAIIDRKVVRQVPEGAFFVSTELDSSVMIVELFPGLRSTMLSGLVDGVLEGDEGVRGLILKTYGTGNAPTNASFLQAIERLCSAGVVVVNVTQCPEGMVELGLYEASAGLLERGVVSGVDMTPEAAVCKLMYLLGKGWPTEKVRRVMQIDLAGEQSANIYSVALEGQGEAAPVGDAQGLLPGEIRFEMLERAILRAHGLRLVNREDAGKEIEIRFFLNFSGDVAGASVDDPHCAAVVRRVMEAGRESELVCDISSASRRLLHPGEKTRVSAAVGTGQGVRWNALHLSVHTEVS